MKKIWMAMAILPITGACGTSHRMKAEDFNQAYMAGNYCQAADVMTGEKICGETKPENIDNPGLLEALNGGSAVWDCNRYEVSLKLFDFADKDIYGDDKASVVTDAGKTTTAVLANSSVLDYQPMIMDGIYLSSYKILNYLAVGDKEGARNEVNRAYLRQQNAAERFRKEIEEAKESAAEEAEDLDEEALESAEESSKEIISEYNQQFSQWKGYKNYLNPYTTYLSGLYFLGNSTGAGDNETAVTYLKRVRGMASLNRFVKEDLKLAENAASGQLSFKKNKPAVWVIFENGMVADFEEFRIDLPVFIATNQVKMVDFAIPRPRVRSEAYPNIAVSFGSGKQVKTQLLADVDRMFISEYNKKFPLILSQAIASMTAKAAMQYVAQKELGDLGGISMAAYSMITTSADLRSWYALPKNVQLAKIANAKGGVMNIFANGEKLAEAEVPAGKNSIVYVRIPAAGAVPAVTVINL